MCFQSVVAKRAYLLRLKLNGIELFESHDNPDPAALSVGPGAQCGNVCKF